MFLFPLELQAILRLSVIDGQDDPRWEESPELADRRRALDVLDMSITRMHWRGRVTMTTVDLRRKHVWKVAGVNVQGGQLYIDRWRPYTATQNGRIRPLEWADLSTDDIKFIALTLGLHI